MSQDIIETLPRISKGTLILDPIKPTDAASLYPIMSDENLMRYVLPPAESVDSLKITLTEMSSVSCQWAGWWTIRSSNESPLGLMMYYGANYHNKYCSIAYIVDRSHHNKGIATGAAQIAIDFLFGAMHFNRIEAEIETDNIASAMLLKKLGFVCEANKLRKRLFLAGEARDTAMYSLLSEDWKIYCV